MKIVLGEDAIAPNEIWKDVGGYEGIYQVSNLGRVKSLERNIKRSDGRQQRMQSCVLAPRIDQYGYYRIGLTDANKVKKSHLVHRLVAEAFIANPDGKMEVDHINTVRIDNRVENLRWVTSSENKHNPISLERFRQQGYARVKYLMNAESRAKLIERNSSPVLEYDTGGNFIAEFSSIVEASRSTGIDKSDIGKCCRGKKTRAGGMVWQYKTTKDKMETIKVTTFAEYQAAAMRTCTESSKNKKYMLTGLLSELGEFIGKYAKAIRDDNGTITNGRRNLMVAELGDCCWMIAGLYDIHGREIPMPEGCATINDFDNKCNLSENNWLGDERDLYHCSLALMNIAGDISKNEFTSGEINFESLYDVLLGVCVCAKEIGSTMQMVMQHNIDKLASRYNRGKIGGSGDER